MYLSRYGCIGCDSALLERFKGYTTVKEVIIEIYTSTCAGGDVVSRKNCNHHPYLFALDCIPERYQPLHINQQGVSLVLRLIYPHSIFSLFLSLYLLFI